MYRNDAEVATTSLHNFVLNHGALGDVITSLPAIVRARQTHTVDMVMRVWVPPVQMELVAHLLAPYGEFEVKDIMRFPFKRVEREGSDIGTVSINQMALNTHTRNRVHMVDYAFGCLTDSRPESMLERSYPTAASTGRLHTGPPYVVFPVGATSDNKLFRASVMAPVMDWCNDKGYVPVLVGTKVSGTVAVVQGGTEKLVIRDEVDKLPALLHSVYPWKDMREKTTLLELRCLLANAAAVVGVDGGTLHLAGTTDVPIVYAMGTTLPKHRYIPRHGDHNYKIRYVGPRDLACTGCQSNWTMTHLDFRFCAYGDNLCMEKLHSDDFIDGLKQLGL